MFKEDLTAFLKNNAGVNALVSGRIYPQTLPQNVVLPAIVYSQISSVRGSSHSGTSGFASCRFQVDIWATTYYQASTVANAVRTALDNYKGVMGSSNVGSAFLENELDGFDPETQSQRVIQDYMIWYQE